MRPDLAAALKAFDEAALEALGSKGLVRRALRDLDEGKLSFAGDEGDAARILVDGETVTIDGRGPASSRCTCPAPGLCRHRIAATLFLRTAVPQVDDVAPEAVDHGALLQSEITALDAAAIAKWAGKASWRAAQELAEAGGPVQIAGSALVIGVGQDEVRYLAGQGLAGMVSKAKPARRKAVHAAAVLLARSHFGLETIPDESEAAETDPAPDDRRVDPVFLAEVLRALAQSARMALNLAPSALEDQLFMLSVSSRADELPRLSRMLRTLSTMLRDRRERAFSFDSDRCLALMAEAFALTAALAKGNADPDAALRGSFRQAYRPVGTLDLAGMGAEVWRSESGARGVTVHLLEPATGRWFSASLARAPGQDSGFDPVAAYDRQTIWQGTTLKRLSRSRFRLKDAASSEDGRLSLGKDVRAVDLVESGLPAGMAVTRWAVLRDYLRTRLTGRLDLPRTGSETVLIQPRRVARPWFDELRQSLIWPVEDQDGVWIGLSVEHGRDRQALVEALEAVASRRWCGTVAVLASVTDRSFVLKPFALGDGERLFNLGLDDVGALTTFAGLATAAERLREIGGFFGFRSGAFETVASPPPRIALSAAWQALADISELGMDTLSAEHSERLERAAIGLRAVGLSVVAEQLGRVERSVRAEQWPRLLGAAYAVRHARQWTLDLPLLVQARA
jgi:hypothetical protein